MKFDPAKFIANIVSVVEADGVLHGAEQAQCDIIRKHFKFTKTEWTQGEKLAHDAGFSLAPTGTFADKVQNLEMMLRVAYADGEAGEKEVEAIARFCGLIGISQEQLDSLNDDVANEILDAPKACHACGGEIPAGSAFCPTCGTPVAPASAGVRTDFDIPETGLSIAFAESTAGGFQRALDLARGTPAFQECVRGKKKWFMASYAPGETGWIELVDALSGLKNCEVYENGTPASWAAVFPWELTSCLRDHDKAYEPDLYCFGKGIDGSNLNPWGCRRIEMSWSGYWRETNWFRMGSWEKSTDRRAAVQWRFDKEKMRFLFNQNAAKIRMCPCFNANILDIVLNALPDVVRPEIDRDWRFHEAWGEGSAGCITVSTKDEFGYTENKQSDGVEPNGLGFFARLMKAIYDKDLVKRICG